MGLITVSRAGAGDCGVESGWDDQGSGGYGHKGGHCRRNGAVEALLGVLEATDKEAATKDEEDVGENGTQHACLNNTNLFILEGDDTDL